ncbi:MAG: hypothetical protein Q4C87_04800 [Actinomycetaceae bacterium]|nr:hypothetical protein [Actinomycetaceae bacterium]
MRNLQGPSPQQIRENRVSRLSTLLLIILVPVIFTWNLPVALIVGIAGACVGAFCVFRKSNWWLLLIPLWWIGGIYGARYLVTDISLLNANDINVLSIYFPPYFAYHAVRSIVVFERSNVPHSSYYVQWSDGQDYRDHINDPTAEQILAEFDKLDGSKHSTLRIHTELHQVDICVLTNDLTLFYHTDKQKSQVPWYAVYAPGHTQEGEYYGPIGGLLHATFNLYAFITRADNRRLLEEFLTTGQRPQSLLWLSTGGMQADLIRPWWD